MLIARIYVENPHFPDTQPNNQPIGTVRKSRGQLDVHIDRAGGKVISIDAMHYRENEEKKAEFLHEIRSSLSELVPCTHYPETELSVKPENFEGPEEWTYNEHPAYIHIPIFDALDHLADYRPEKAEHL